MSNADLWAAKYGSYFLFELKLFSIIAVISNVHPDNGKEIPRLLRMSAFVPTNIPIVIGMSIAKPTVNY